ncbi:MAG: hypothetical protein SF052_25200 [Bacteroidia bacterium]|nr:hypothetical protein [Bacteroidia bacterium]
MVKFLARQGCPSAQRKWKRKRGRPLGYKHPTSPRSGFARHKDICLPSQTLRSGEDGFRRSWDAATRRSRTPEESNVCSK